MHVWAFWGGVTKQSPPDSVWIIFWLCVQVITEAIATDKVTIDPLVKDKSRELKIERILLIAQKMQQLLGKEVNVDELICSAG